MAPHRPYVRCSRCGARCASRHGLCAKCRPGVLQQHFLEAYAHLGTVASACRACELPPSVVYRWLDEDSTFLGIYEQAQKYRRERLVSLLYQAAIGELGTVTETVISRGRKLTRVVEKVTEHQGKAAVLGKNGGFIRFLNYGARRRRSYSRRRGISSEPSLTCST